VGARKVSRPYKEQREKWGIVVFLNEFIIIGCFFLCECMCELNEINMKRMRELLVP
jgi:hypothetical protein